MPVDYAALEPGQTISRRTYRLSADMVARYVEAVDDRSAVFDPSDRPAVAPAMAVAALTLRGVVEDLQMPSGTLHAGQELEFHAAVSVGETLECEATIAQSSVRAERRFVVVELSVRDSTGLRVMSGKSTLVVPV